MNRYYKKFDIVKSEDGEQYFQPPSWIRKEFSDIPSKELIIEDGDRLDVIAEQIYGDPNLWKAIAMYNNIGYFFELQPGDKLYLPIEMSKLLERL
jgi:nucleoid-associated protein YgaU